MGAITFSIDASLLQVLQKNLPLDIFIETGTYQGDTVEIANDYFQKIFSIELSKEYYDSAHRRFEQTPKINLIHGSSATALTELASQYADHSIIYWLDAHWCAAPSINQQSSQCPLLAELKSIKNINPNSVIIIDDARLFLSPPPAPHVLSDWPTFDEIIHALHALSNNHQVMVLNDNIVFFPTKINKALTIFAQQYGADWLTIADKSRDYDKLLSQLQEKEQEITNLKETCNQQSALLSPKLLGLFGQLSDRLTGLETKTEDYDRLHSQLREKEQEIIKLKEICIQKSAIEEKYEAVCQAKQAVIEEQKKALKAFQQASLKERIKAFLRPHLLSLYHYDPKPLEIPTRYNRKTTSQNLPTISIVTPAFNHGEFIERTLNSVITQDYPKLEYIVQDGGSQDKTIEILKQYQSSLTHWQSIKDNGQSNAINLGFRHTSGEIMAYLNSDDLLLPGALHYVGHYFSTHPNVDVVYGHRILIDEYDQEIGRWVLPKHDSNILSWADYIPQETLFWRRSLWDKVGGKIDESFRFAMDWDLILRFREIRAHFVRLPRFLGAFRIHPHQKTSAEMAELGTQEMQRLRLRCHGRHITIPEINRGIKSYLTRNLIYQKLYRAGVLRY